MRKRIYANMMLLTVLSMLILSTLLCIEFYNKYSSTIRQEMQNRIQIFRDHPSPMAMEAFSKDRNPDIRITLISPEGSIVLDNTVQTAAMENHKNREEVIEANQTGQGESKRYSDTMGKETYYYAVKLTDGYILRGAKTTDSIFSMFAGILPIVAASVFAVILLGYVIAGKLTSNIVKPMNDFQSLDITSSPYVELLPFIRTIKDQRERITEQMDHLKERSATISAIMDNMNEGIILVDRQGFILSANQSVLHIFDRTEPMERRNILELFRDVELISHVRAALSGHRGEIKFDHDEKIYRVYFSPVIDSGAIILFLDITEQAKAETMRQEFSANVSHELKTPLTTIYGNAEMLAGGIVKEKDKQHFYLKIKDEATRLIALIDDIIMISKLDEGNGQETLIQVDLFAIANETVESLSGKAADNNINMRLTGASATMKTNRSQMVELMYNLVDNAIKYNKPNGTVHIDVSSNDDKIKLTVSDTGIGIPKEAQSRVFERFYRVEKSRSKSSGGTGLGLAIVKHIVMVQGGSIELSSSMGEGTTVTVIFDG